MPAFVKLSLIVSDKIADTNSDFTLFLGRFGVQNFKRIPFLNVTFKIYE
jgi:hypothetical protein